MCDRMGTLKRFDCPACGYSACVSGGLDYGFMTVVQTMICEDCRDVVDVLVGQMGHVGPTGDPEYDARLNLCPECRGIRLSAWVNERPCPRCAEPMTESSEPVANWD